MTTITRAEPRKRQPETMPTVAARFSIRRTASLARSNAVLLSRNRLALFYAVLMPLLPLALLFAGERGSPAVGAVAIVVMFQAIALLPIYYTTSSPGSCPPVLILASRWYHISNSQSKQPNSHQSRTP